MGSFSVGKGRGLYNILHSVRFGGRKRGLGRLGIFCTWSIWLRCMAIELGGYLTREAAVRPGVERNFCCRECFRVERTGDKSAVWVKTMRSSIVVDRLIVRLAIRSGVVGGWEEDFRLRFQMLLVAM